eukprot:TRINITY_DN23170_c0_g1_i1.p1 TRINITY_DN23170_c0_g1~~TRINITY_DN23170_c0_g1_i1.p1  ORF type:complete len:753 (-),score=76.64 TRINITY_DN23170_c0_g1_i1:374-2632(-)
MESQEDSDQHGIASPSRVLGPASSTTRIDLAALFVRKALDGEPLDSSRLLLADSGDRRVELALQAHRLRALFVYVRWTVIWCLILTSLFVEPWWCGKIDRSATCNDPQYFTSGLAFLTREQSLLLETLALVCLMADLALWCVVLGSATVFAWKWRMFHALLLFTLAVDVIFAAVQLPDSSWRLGPYCRAILLVAYDTTLQQEVISLLRSASELAKVLLLLAVFIVVYAWFGAVLWTIAGPEGQYFTNFGTSLWTLLVLLTTNNYPDVMLPGYTENRANAIYFITFLVIALFLLLQLVIAVIYNGYTRQLEVSKKHLVEIRQGLFDDAFRLLDTDSQGSLDRQQFDLFLAGLNKYGGFRIGDEARRTLTFAVLDSHGTGRIEQQEFTDLAFALSLEFQPLHQPWLQQRAPGLWYFCRLDRVKDGLMSSYFNHTIDLILLVGVASTVAETWPFLAGEKSQRPNVFSWGNAMDITLTLIFLFEMLLKLVLLGWSPYWSSFENRFDAVATVAAVGAVLYVVFPNGYHDYFLVKIPVLCRFVRLFRLLHHVPAFHTIFEALVAVKPGARRVLPLLLCAMLFFNALGCDLFGGLITTDPGNPSSAKLTGTAFATGLYFPMNFNDAPSGLVVLFGCLVMNNWDTYVDGFAAVAGTVARIYFVAWFIVGVLIGMNLLTSVVLDAFVNRWGALHSRGSEDVGDGRAIIDVGVVTGTTTGLTGSWAVLSRRPSAAATLRERLSTIVADGTLRNPLGQFGVSV